MTPLAARFERLMNETAATADLKSRTLRGGAVAMGAEAVEFVLRVGSLLVLARLLLPEHFGLIAMVTAVTSVAERFKDLGLSIATVQREHITHEQVSTLFWVNTAMGMALVLLVAALAWPIAGFYGEPRLVAVTLAIASSFFWSGVTVQHQALLRRQMKFSTLAMVQIGSSALSVVVAITMALLDFGYWALVAREVSRGVFMALGMWLCMPWIPSAPARSEGMRSMLAFGGDVTAFNLVAFLSSSLDQILIGKLFGATPLGLYRQGVNLVLAPIVQLTYPVNSVAESALSRLRGEPEKYRRYYLRILSTLSLATMPLAAFLAVFAEEIVQVALGPKWLAAAEFFRILAIAAFLRPAMSTVGAVMITQGLSRRYFWWGLAGSACLSVLLLAGTAWGATGVAAAQVVSTYLMVWPNLHWGLKNTPISKQDFLSAISRPIAASLLMTAVLVLLSHLDEFIDHPAILLAIGAVAAVPLYFGAWLILPRGREELSRIKDDLLSLRRRDQKPTSNDAGT